MTHGGLFDFASRDPADHDGVADGIGWAALAFRSSGHSYSLMLSGRLRKGEKDGDELGFT